MSKMSILRPYFTYTGAAVRELCAKGDKEAAAELAVRKAKGSTTVAALRSQGRTAEADAKVAAAKAAKAAAKAAKPSQAVAVAAPTHPVTQGVTKAVAFTRTNERVDALEKSMLALAGAVAEQHKVIALIAKKLGVE